MADPLSISILNNKRNEIVSTIEAYEEKLRQARIDLTHINAAIKLFAQDGETVTPYVDVGRLFRRMEIITLCEGWIRQDGPLDTRQLTTRLMQAKGLDLNDRVLFRSILTRASTLLGMHAKRGRFDGSERRNKLCVWRVVG